MIGQTIRGQSNVNRKRHCKEENVCKQGRSDAHRTATDQTTQLNLLYETRLVLLSSRNYLFSAEDSVFAQIYSAIIKRELNRTRGIRDGVRDVWMINKRDPLPSQNCFRKKHTIFASKFNQRDEHVWALFVSSILSSKYTKSKKLQFSKIFVSGFCGKVKYSNFKSIKKYSSASPSKHSLTFQFRLRQLRFTDVVNIWEIIGILHCSN